VSILGLIGIILGFLAIPVAFTQPTRLKITYMAMIYLIHIAACVVYYWRAEEGVADSAMYYHDPYQSYQDGFHVGTQGLIYVIQYLRDIFGGTYLDFFLLFQAIGFLGITVLLRVFEEIHDELRLPHAPYFYALMAIPSLHFWSSAIGKDGPFLLATSLVLWATMHLRSRGMALIGALLLMLFFRPHVAIVAGVGLALAVAIGKGIPAYLRVGMLLIALVGTVVATVTLQSVYAIDITSAESISQQFERRDNVLNSEDAGTTAVTGPFPVRLLSLMFRPLFFDAKELFGLIASVESLLVVWMVLLLLLRSREVLGLLKSVFFARFALIYSVGMTLFLAIGYWNVGLGLRQKWTMLMPMYLALLVTVIAVRRARKLGLGEAVRREVDLGFPPPPAMRPQVQAPSATH
jgi:hypothetical protein